MNSDDIDEVIQRLQADEHAGDDIRELLMAVAEREGRDPAGAAVDEAVRFVLAYITEVPYLFKVAAVAARHAGLDAPMNRVLDSLRGYWRHDHDLIPDQLGVIGLLDDAYCSRAAMQAISDQFRMLSGKHLFPFDMRAANQAVRRLLGEPYAGDLDRYVAEMLNAAGIMPALHQLADGQKRIDLEAARTLWHHDRTEAGASLASLTAIVGD
jgi:uncharacterized membrane protein YkvA (DUF1232 family)